MYRCIKNSDVPSFLQCKIPVKTQLNVKQCEKVLDDYWDTQLFDLIKYGFPLDLNENIVLHCEQINQCLALKFPAIFKHTWMKTGGKELHWSF